MPIPKNFLGLQAGDVPRTFADISLLRELTGFEPETSLEIGIEKFVKWYIDYFRGNKKRENKN